ncbi:MAG: nitroreductase family protein [Deltaproteobacteria bacterium]|nr:nitroreductase family protein [Deltaproteobacteria bacterium]
MNYEPFVDLLRQRKSVRRYRPDPVPDDVIQKILEAARYAPSAGNSQPWEFIVIKDEAARKNISKSIALQIKEEVGKDPDIARGIAVQPFLYTAPVLIVVCGDPRLQEAYPAWMDRYALFRQSLSNCIYTIQLAAATFGLATAWATIQSGPTQEVVRDILGIPSGYTVDHIIPVGHPNGDILHFEKYDIAKFRSDDDVKNFIWSKAITRIPKEGLED